MSVILVEMFKGMPLVIDIGVKKEHHRKGLRKALLEIAINSLVQENYNELPLFVTYGNILAEQLYKSLG